MLSENEIRARAARFILDHKDDCDEKSQSQKFLEDFFDVFGVNRFRAAAFEHRVKIDDSTKYIDLLWKGVVLIEMKSRGKNLDKAYDQAKNYVCNLPDSELPKWILCCDFETIDCYDLEHSAQKTSFKVAELPDKIEFFSFMCGRKNQQFLEQLPVNIEAAERMGKVYDQLKEFGYTGHNLEIYLVRLLFCMFADDTGIFPSNALLQYIQDRTNPDGSDLAAKLSEFFYILNTPKESRMKNLDAALERFPYVNGKLFEVPLPPAAFDSKMRNELLECCKLDWSRISPDIFGSMFQSVMDPKERRSLGAHYTSEENIRKLIDSLFLDELWDEFKKICALTIGKQQKLEAFHEKLSKLKFLDPACGCGNFLVITYRELRRLENAVLKELYSDQLKQGEQFLDIEYLCKVNVDQFYGIELEDFPAQVAKVALWLTDHQMNIETGREFGGFFIRIPLKTSPTIVCANALTTDWETVVPKTELNYIIGNPPFGGARVMSAPQKKELDAVFGKIKGANNLDFVTCWYRKAAEYIQDTQIECAFVSTNSICQGEQVAILWKHLFRDFNIKINFAHQTFKWSNEAKGNAAVYCVIVGFSLIDRPKKQLFFYEQVNGEPVQVLVSRINAYLLDAPNVFIENRTRPICDVPFIKIGCQPIDGGHYLFTQEEKDAFVAREPKSEPLFRILYGAKEFINNSPRWCLFLKDTDPKLLRSMPLVTERVEKVRLYRKNSNRAATRKCASTPTLFGGENIPKSSFLAIPKTSSEHRSYIPIGFMTSDIVCNDALMISSDATLYHFGVLTSSMHIAWTKYVCGRLKSDYRYSVGVVYNNYPWPVPSDKQKAEIEAAAQEVLDTRANYPEASYADLYDPSTMPPDLVKAHNKLDRAVEKAYRSQLFNTDTERAAFLFERYQELSAPLISKQSGGKRKKNTDAD